MTRADLQEQLARSQFVADVAAGNIPSPADCAAATDEELQAAMYAPLFQPTYDVGVMCATQNAIQAERGRREVGRMPADIEAIADDPECSAEHREAATSALEDLKSGADPEHWAAHAWWFRHSVRTFRSRATHSGTSRRRSTPAKTSTRTRARGSGRPAARSTRSSARSGDSGDGPGESDQPPACHGCGAELLSPAPFCGLCAIERGERRCTCAICGSDISHRHSHAETCGPRCKKALQRRRARAAAPDLFGIARVDVPPDPLEGVDPDIFWCVYRNGCEPRELVAA